MKNNKVDLTTHLKNLDLGIEQDNAYVIAEISCNHGGNRQNLMQLIRNAAASGANAVKLQAYTPDVMACKNKSPRLSEWNKKTLYKIYEEAQTFYDYFKDAFKLSKELGIDCFSSVFDLKTVDFLEELDCMAYKISASESNYTQLIKKVIKTGKPILISFPYGIIEDHIYDILLNCDNYVVPFYCVNDYPSPKNIYHIKRMNSFWSKFGTSYNGYSDHSIGIDFAVGAYYSGARVIEKHFKFDGKPVIKTSKFPTLDEKFSIDSIELQNLVDNVTYKEKNEKDKLLKCRVLQRSIWVTETISKGDIFTESNIKILRGNIGRNLNDYESILGTASKKDYESGQPLKL
jgi:pseudaminic acid synthase